MNFVLKFNGRFLPIATRNSIILEVYGNCDFFICSSCG